MDHFIPNDTYIADGGRVALITGANCSGKSVYLKQVPKQSVDAQQRCWTEHRAGDMIYVLLIGGTALYRSLTR